MTKEELKEQDIRLNKLCFDYQEKEKRIAELVDLIHAERKRQEQCDDIHLKKISDLEKENAELKAQCDCEKCYSLARAYRNDNEKQKEQLTKAKHIIIECIDVMSFHDCEYTDAYKEAKDFILKDSEVEKWQKIKETF